MTPQRIVWHHSADKKTTEQFSGINSYHKERGFPRSKRGYYVGYHYVIERDGSIKQARDEDEIGAHDTGENINSIGICFAGDFTTEYPTEAQAQSGAILVEKLHNTWGIPITRIEPHRWDDDTECPGRFLLDNWLIKQYLTRSGTPLVRLFHYIGQRFNLL